MKEHPFTSKISNENVPFLRKRCYDDDVNFVVLGLCLKEKMKKLKKYDEL